MTDDQVKRETASREVEAPKRPYETPKLKRHGSVEELTRNLGLSGSDGIIGSQI